MLILEGVKHIIRPMAYRWDIVIAFLAKQQQCTAFNDYWLKKTIFDWIYT